MGGFLDWAFRDALLIMIAILILMINPVAKQEEEESHIKVQGNMVVTIAWDTGTDVDIDTWVKVPHDNIMSFRNKGTRFCNLLRDDTGISHYDVGEEKDVIDIINTEMAMCRNIAANEEVIIGIHYYKDHDIDGGRPVTVSYSVKVMEGQDFTNVVNGKVKLKVVGEEKTLATFKLNEHGYVYGVSTEFRSLTHWTAP